MFFIAMLLYAPHYCLTGKRGNPGLRPAQANGQQSKDCMPSVSLRSTLFASMAVCDSHSKRFVLFPTTGNEYQEAF